MNKFRYLDDVLPGRQLPIACVEMDGQSTQIFCRVPDLETLRRMEFQTGQVVLTYVPVLGWVAHALELWEREHGSVEPALWEPVAAGLSVPAPVYRLEETGLVIVQEAGSVKAVLDLHQDVTHLPGIFLSHPEGVDAGEVTGI